MAEKDKMHTGELYLPGDKEIIEKRLKEEGVKSNNVEIVHAPDIITNDDIPTKAIKEKINSSLAVCFDILKRDEDCIGLVSAGSTGATLAGGFLKIGRIKGVSRPALCPFLPTKKGGQVLLLDCGANMDANAINLCHFALMGKVYYESIIGTKNPRIALLNVGTEDHKGNELIKQVFPMLKQLDINFVGNMEARDIMSGDYDIVVADGFAGNVLLKATEGALKLMLGEIKKAVKRTVLSKIGALFMKKSFKEMKAKFDFDVYGGSPFLGCKKAIIKAHGSSKSVAFNAAFEQVLKLHNTKLNEKLESSVAGCTLENFNI